MSELRLRLLTFLYGSETAAAVAPRVERLVAAARPAGIRDRWSERDVWLITYPDQFRAPGEAPLRTLDRFFSDHLDPWMNGLHVLPFYPWTSDDGFSVTDFSQVDPIYGTWGDVEALAARRRLGVDAVLNHMSASSGWFRGFLDGDPRYAGFFRTADPGADLSAVVRPRTSPLLTPFESPAGTRHVWTTFSADQVDLDYANPEVLLAVLEAVLGYGDRGAGFIRLDAVGLLWKEEGTSCMHLPQTHAVVQLLRSCLDDAHPGVLVLTETNVPHAENVSYFGDGTVPEAQMVYQFPLAPLVLHTLRRGDAGDLSVWAAGLDLPVPGTTFFNFLASHDGVGVRPLEGLVAPGAVEALVELTAAAGGQVSSRAGPDGAPVPYELNSTWYDLLAAGVDSQAAGLARHFASHAIMLALRGIPGLYVHSLFASPNDHHGFAASGRARSLNRSKFTDSAELDANLADPSSRAARALAGLQRMCRWRASHPAFHPDAGQRILDLGTQLFAVEREGVGGARALVVVNVTGDEVPLRLSGTWAAFDGGEPGRPLGRWESRWLHEPGPQAKREFC